MGNQHVEKGNKHSSGGKYMTKLKPYSDLLKQSNSNAINKIYPYSNPGAKLGGAGAKLHWALDRVGVLSIGLPSCWG